jgi:hypothetical protein
MNFLIELMGMIIFFFPYVFPSIFLLVLYILIGIKLPFWKYATALILGELLIHFSIIGWPNMSLDRVAVAYEIMDLILVASLIGTCLYSVRRRRRGPAEGVK